MQLKSLLLLPAFLTFAPLATATLGGGSSYAATCLKIKAAYLLSPTGGKVHTPGTPAYQAGIKHWSTMSTEQSACVVEPGSALDVAIALKIIALDRAPFAVKGGGHATNKGTSSTPGVHITMSKFKEVKYNAQKQTAEVGSGLVWDEVYQALEPYNRTVVGGRSTGVGVAGLALGGGYSWLTNQHGLAIDNIVGYELVRPNGLITQVTQASDAQLFNGLKGGMNNFGIVTKFILKTHPQTQVWGGLIVFLATEFQAVTQAIANFESMVTDPKAAIIASYQIYQGVPMVAFQMFYDGPTPPAGMFDVWLGLPNILSTVGTFRMSQYIRAFAADTSVVTRSQFHSASVLGYGPNLLNAVVNETLFWSQPGALPGPPDGFFIGFAVEPFLSSIYTHNSAETAYPFTRDNAFSPLNVYFGWSQASDDAVFNAAHRASVKQLEDAAFSDGDTGVRTAPIYPNYALPETPLERIYGPRLPGLRQLKERIDPSNVMGLAGGFKL